MPLPPSAVPALVLAGAVALAAEAAAAAGEGPPSEDVLREVAASRAWRRLLHYGTSRAGRVRSRVDGPGFFLAGEAGKGDPLLELRAALAALADPDATTESGRPPACAFPLRRRFLEERGLLLDGAPRPDCPELDAHMARFDPSSGISLAFAGAWPNNPGSMFGHTLLRVRTSREGASGLLDHGLGYAALVPPDESGVLFALKGVFGGYRGQLSVLPWHAKLRAYSDVESRDIWEHRLSLSTREVEAVLLHAWELGTNGWIDYFFFDENCATLLLALLEAARPSLALTDLRRPFLTPADSVKLAAAVPGLVADVSFHPSLLARARNLADRLPPDGRDALDRLLAGRGVEETEDAAALDAAALHLSHAGSDPALLHRILARRSVLPAGGPPPPPPVPPGRPDQGHDPQLLAVSAGTSGGQAFQELSWRSAYHDLMADDRGHKAGAEILFPSLAARAQGGRVRLESLGLLSITSLSPWERLRKPWSWSLALGLVRERASPRCRPDGCLAARARGGLGAAVPLLGGRALLAGLALANAEAGGHVRKGADAGPVLSLSLLAGPLGRQKSRISHERFLALMGNGNSWSSLSWDHAVHLARNWEARVKASNKKTQKKSLTTLEASLLYYFM